MQHAPAKYILSFFLGIIIFSLLISQSASDNGHAGNPKDQMGSGSIIERDRSKQTIHQTSTTVTFNSRSEIYEVILGTFMIIVGLFALALALYRWNPKDLSLIAFGAFCFIYGARSSAIQFLLNTTHIFWEYWRWFLTYFTPVPVWIFFEQIIGVGWKSSIRRLWQVQIIFVIVIASVSLILRSPGAAKEANNVMVIIGILVVGINLFRAGHETTREMMVLKCGGVIWAIAALIENISPLLAPGFNVINIEPFGFFVFLGCVVYVVAYRFFHYEKDLFTITHELETARQIQSFILPRNPVDMSDINLAAHYVPMAAVAGDLYDFIKVDEKRLGILVADVSGHGVPASLISSMVKIAVSSQLPHASNPAQVLAGINQILCGKLENDFVTAGYLFIDTDRQTATYAGAGHPPLLLLRRPEQKIYEYRKNGIVLGQLEDAQYKNIEFSLISGDRCILYTDGIIEATNAAGDFFGWYGFKKFITSHGDLSAGDFADGLIQHISTWSGKHADQALDDDLTLVVADFKTLV